MDCAQKDLQRAGISRYVSHNWQLSSSSSSSSSSSLVVVRPNSTIQDKHTDINIQYNEQIDIYNQTEVEEMKQEAPLPRRTQRVRRA